jgi:cardiolipin synthase
MTPASELAFVVAETARLLPADQVELVAAVVERRRGSDPSAQQGLRDLVPTEAFRAAVGRLVRAWDKHPQAGGESIALSLRAASAAYREARDESTVEVVWTGPEGDVDVRLTYAVLIEVIRAASRRLTLVSFAAHRVQEVAEALRVAVDRGTEVRLILDGGTAADRAYHASGGIFVYTWPPTLLPDHDSGHASLHAKAAIADDKIAFVTSANLTGYALYRNMELGLVVRGGDVPRLLADHFAGLIDRGVLVRA